MVNYLRARVKLTNTQLNKLKSASKNKAGAILRINKKNVQDEAFSHELFVTKRPATKMRNAFPNNMSTDIKLSKTQTTIIIQSGGSFCFSLANLGKKSTNKCCYSFS